MTDERALFETMYSCHAMRRLHPDPVPEQHPLQLIDAAYQAPSAETSSAGVGSS